MRNVAVGLAGENEARRRLVTPGCHGRQAGQAVEGTVDFALLPAILLIYIEILLIVGFALFFSTFVSPTLSAVMTLIVFVTGHLIGILRDYIQLYRSFE